MAEKEGRIVKLTGGFYYVEAEGEIIECRARGKFRLDGLSPCVGDIAEVEMTDSGKGYVVGIKERKNFLIRPNVANIDLLIMVLSVCDPPVNYGVCDRLLAVCAYKNIDAAIVITKADMEMEKASEVASIYEKAGFKTIITGENMRSREELSRLIEGKLCVLTGNTGVGKSTLLNFLDDGLSLATGEISKKLGRGRHTTRTVGIFNVCGAFIADTPGFSSLETIRLQKIKKQELQFCFKEFIPYIEQCRFTGCSHTGEKGCAVIEAVKEDNIPLSRHKSYCEMYEEAKTIKDWE